MRDNPHLITQHSKAGGAGSFITLLLVLAVIVVIYVIK